MNKLITRASSINRALDEVGDKWCLLILQEVFWGINSFNAMRAATGASRGVLSNRLKWLQFVNCLSRETEGTDGAGVRYRLTPKSLELYQCALMAVQWERSYFSTPALDDVVLVHQKCGAAFLPQLSCGACRGQIGVWEVDYRPGPGSARDEREKKVRRRSSIPVHRVPSERRHYLNLINIVGDRWTANLIALAFHGLTRFDQFHRELPVATNILSGRLKFLVTEGIFVRAPCRDSPRRQEYRLTRKGEDTFPWFLTLLQWGDRWCDPAGKGPPMDLSHRSCGALLQARVTCNACGENLQAREVVFQPG